jgi:hypothetical protein
MSTVRDHLWLWGHEPGSHDTEWGLPWPSRITPVEAAWYMRIPNVIMVRYGPVPLPPDDQYLVPFRTLDRVVWSMVGAGGMHQPADVDRVLKVSDGLPNMTGVMMDDFFRTSADAASADAASADAASADANGVGVIDAATLAQDVRSLKARSKPLDLWVVLYDHQLGLPVRSHLELCDVVTFWTWEAANLERLEANFAQFEQVAPATCSKVLGCYMWDYGSHRPMPVNLMEQQCTRALRWLREGRIDGMIFLASCICDLGLETVEWTRNWIREFGSTIV